MTGRILICALIALLCGSQTMAQRKTTEFFFFSVDLHGSEIPPTENPRLYLRVYNDGIVEYVDTTENGGVSKFATKRYKLTNAEKKSLMAYLRSKDLQNLATEYLPPDGSREYKTDLIIFFATAKTISVSNFSPDALGAEKTYPPALIKLLCRIEQLRKEASYKFVSNSVSWCSK